VSAPSPISLLFGSISIVMGAVHIIFPREFATVDDRGISKYRFGNRDDTAWKRARAVGVLYVIMGAIFILSGFGSPEHRDLAWFPWFGAAMILIGLWALLVEPHVADWQRDRYNRRVVAREARGTDAYFEEQRSLEAYRPEGRTNRARLLTGAMAIVFGASCLILSRTI